MGSPLREILYLQYTLHFHGVSIESGLWHMRMVGESLLRPEFSGFVVCFGFVISSSGNEEDGPAM